MHPCPKDLSAIPYHKTDYPSLFVKELTQQDSNLNCNLQCEIRYIAIFIYIEIGGCAFYVVLATNERIFSTVQSIPEIKFPIQDCFLQKNLLLKILHYFYEHFIIPCATLQEITSNRSGLKTVKSKLFQGGMTAPSCRADIHRE